MLKSLERQHCTGVDQSRSSRFRSQEFKYQHHSSYCVTLYKLLNFPALYLPVSRDNNRIYLCRGVVKIRRANACAWPSPFKRHYPETQKMNHEFTVSLLRQGKAHQKKSCPSREKKLHVSSANSAELGSQPVIPDLRPGLFSGKSTHSLSMGSENPQRLYPQGAGL